MDLVNLDNHDLPSSETKHNDEDPQPQHNAACTNLKLILYLTKIKVAVFTFGPGSPWPVSPTGPGGPAGPTSPWRQNNKVSDP